MQAPLDQETQAVYRLIDEIDSLDRWRDRVGRRILAVFLTGFLLAVTLLVWMVNRGQRWARPPHQTHSAAGSIVPAAQK